MVIVIGSTHTQRGGNDTKVQVTGDHLRILLQPSTTSMYPVQACKAVNTSSFNFSFISLLNCIWHGNTEEFRMPAFLQSGKLKKELISKRAEVIRVAFIPLIQAFQK